jgi:DNA-binding MarR family transcriptional regulator
MATQESYAIAVKTLDILPFVMRVMSAEMRSANIALAAGQYGVVDLLEKRPRTLSELATRLHVSLPTMSNSVRALEARGMVQRRHDTEDRRLVWVELTPQGTDALDAMREQVAQRIATWLDALTDEQRATLMNGLSTLRDAFAAGQARDPALSNFYEDG